jgi:hypothetical protein
VQACFAVPVETGIWRLCHPEILVVAASPFGWAAGVCTVTGAREEHTERAVVEPILEGGQPDEETRRNKNGHICSEC